VTAPVPERRSGLAPPGEPGAAFPLGAAVTLAELTDDPHPVLRRLRAAEPVSWLPVLGGWLVTRRDLADQVLRDARGFTVDDPRFTTARVVGPSMLSLDGPEHRRHRDPFARALRRGDVSARLAEFTAAEAARLVAGLAPSGAAELRRALAGPLAVAVMAEVLGLGDTDPATLLSRYDAIVAGVSALTAASGQGQARDAAGPPAAIGPPAVGGAGPAGLQVPATAAAAFEELRVSLEAAISEPGASSLLAVAAATAGLSGREIVSNAAVMLFGGIETTEGMICNAVWHLLGDPVQAGTVRTDRSLLGGTVDESLRLEPAATVVDRFATADAGLGPARIRAGDLVVVSLAGANRDPASFIDPDRFDVRRPNARQNLGFALGPHYCVGAQLAWMETRAAITALLDRLPALRLDPGRPARPRGLVFRKPPALHVLWDAPAALSRQPRPRSARDQPAALARQARPGTCSEPARRVSPPSPAPHVLGIAVPDSGSGDLDGSLGQAHPVPADRGDRRGRLRRPECHEQRGVMLRGRVGVPDRRRAAQGRQRVNVARVQRPGRLQREA
jgi:cytochrome P450